MTPYITHYVRNCVTCQAAKHENVTPPGLLQPLPISSEVWIDISMDFITTLPKSAGKDVIFVVVDRLSIYSHFMAISHPYTAVSEARFTWTIFSMCMGGQGQ